MMCCQFKEFVLFLVRQSKNFIVYFMWFWVMILPSGVWIRGCAIYTFALVQREEVGFGKLRLFCHF